MDSSLSGSFPHGILQARILEWVAIFFSMYTEYYIGKKSFPVGLVVKNPPANAGDMGLIPRSGIPWRRKWQLTPVYLPGESHGQRSLAGYSPWGPKRVRHDLVTKQQQLIDNNSHHLLNVDYYQGTGPNTVLSFNLLNSQNSPLI